MHKDRDLELAWNDLRKAIRGNDREGAFDAFYRLIGERQKSYSRVRCSDCDQHIWRYVDEGSVPFRCGCEEHRGRFSIPLYLNER